VSVSVVFEKARSEGRAALVGYLPAMVAYRTDVAKALVAAP